MTDSKIITLIDSRGVATVTLNHPEKHNAFDDTMIAELREAFDKLATCHEVRVVVLAAVGNTFSAGADMDWMKRMAEFNYEHNHRDAQLLAGMLKALHDLPQPTVARVQGATYGGAVGLVSCCDMAVAEASAIFCLSEVRVGLIPATIAPYVMRAIGERAARRYFTTAERIRATEAQCIGLVSEVANANALDAVVETMVSALLQNGPVAVRASKQLAVDFSGRDITPELIEDSCMRIAAIRVSEEGQEGLEAFLNKRQPNWVGD